MQQLIKFCVVGFSSTVISQVVLGTLLRLAPAIPWWLSLAISFMFGLANGFYWNRRWTFKSRQAGNARRQFPIFMTTNLIGLGLNVAITKAFLIFFTHQLVHGSNPDPNTTQLASIMAIPLVVVWNFTASRLWTFRAPRQNIEPNLNGPPIASAE